MVGRYVAAWIRWAVAAVVLLIGDPGLAVGPIDEPNGRGPELRGRVVDGAGRPVEGAKIILHGGLATRWKIDEARTDAEGRYRFETIRSTMIRDEEKGLWDFNVGVQVEHPTLVEADGRSWRDMRIPGLPEHVETLDLRLTPAGFVAATLKDAKTGKPLSDLNLRIMHPIDTRGHGTTFLAYATTDGQGHFRSIGLFPGEYDVEVNSTTLGRPRVGRVKVEAGQTTEANFDLVAIPEIIEGVVLDADGQRLLGVDLTLLDPKDEGVEVRGKGDYQRVKSDSWTLTNRWQDRFQLAFLPGLERARFVLAFDKERGGAKVLVDDLRQGKPIRLRPW